MQIGAKYNIFLKYEKTQTFQKKMTKTAEERLQNVGGGSFVKKKLDESTNELDNSSNMSSETKTALTMTQSQSLHLWTN